MMHCGLRDLPRRGPLPLAAGQMPWARSPAPSTLIRACTACRLVAWPGQTACGIPGTFIRLCAYRKDAAMLGFAAAVLLTGNHEVTVRYIILADVSFRR